MRIVIFLCLLNNVFSQISASVFNCEELTSNIQTLKDSNISKKEKFSCILNLLKSALTDELENSNCDEEKTKVQETDKNLKETEVAVDPVKVNNETIIEEKEVKENVTAKVTKEKKKISKNSNHNLDVPTMIPIFKPRPIKERPDLYPTRTRSIPAESSVGNSISTPPMFTIPCQKAADVLDMTVAPKSEQIKLQPNLKLMPPETKCNTTEQKKTLVQCMDLDETIEILFKPKAISLIEVYGNLMKKITITVLVPYHMSKMGQKAH